MKLIFEWTGEFRPPKMDEWYLYSTSLPPREWVDYSDALVNYWILRRVEVEENESEAT